MRHRIGMVLAGPFGTTVAPASAMPADQPASLSPVPAESLTPLPAAPWYGASREADPAAGEQR